MVRKLHCKSRRAFTMIELIFAIVIISIAVISLPMMAQVTSRSIESSLVQEAIFAGSVEIMQSLSYRWDRNSAENNTAGELSTTLDIANDCNNNVASLRYAKRPGHIRRSCYNDLTDLRSNIAANLSDANITNLNNAIDTNNSNIFTGTDSNGYGYKKLYTKRTDVNISGFGTSNVGNIKRVQTTITASDDANVRVVLEAYSANIGEVELIRRSNFL